VGIAAGFLCRSALNLLPAGAREAAVTYVLLGGLAVGMAIFAMVVTNTEHPPAASIALGLVLNGFEPRVILFIVLGIVSLSVIKLLLRPLLKNLL
jgi:CBS-domain-containing membrane protein